MDPLTDTEGDFSMTQEDATNIPFIMEKHSCSRPTSTNEPKGCFTWGSNYVGYNTELASTKACTGSYKCIKKISSATRRRLMTSFTKLRVDANRYGFKPHNITLAVGTYTYKNDDGVGTIEVKDCNEETLEAALSKNSRELVAEIADVQIL